MLKGKLELIFPHVFYEALSLITQSSEHDSSWDNLVWNQKVCWWAYISFIHPILIKSLQMFTPNVLIKFLQMFPPVRAKCCSLCMYCTVLIIFTHMLMMLWITWSKIQIVIKIYKCDSISSSQITKNSKTPTVLVVRHLK